MDRQEGTLWRPEPGLSCQELQAEGSQEAVQAVCGEVRGARAKEVARCHCCSTTAGWAWPLLT